MNDTTFEELYKRPRGAKFPLFDESIEIRSTLTKAALAAQRGTSICLIAADGDTLELESFCEEAFDGSGASGVHVVRPEDHSIFWEATEDCAKSLRGVVIASGDALGVDKLDQMERIRHPRTNDPAAKNRIFLVRFASKWNARKDMKLWSPEIRRLFGVTIRWPPLTVRMESDGEEIIRWALQNIIPAHNLPSDIHFEHSAIVMLFSEPPETVKELLVMIGEAAIHANASGRERITSSDLGYIGIEGSRNEPLLNEDSTAPPPN